VLYIAEKCSKQIQRNQRSEAVNILVKEVKSIGLNKVLQVIKVKNLKLLCEHSLLRPLCEQYLEENKKPEKEKSPNRERSKSPTKKGGRRPGRPKSSKSKSRSKSPKKGAKKKAVKKDPDAKKYPPKSVMLRILFEKWIEAGITKFLEEYESSTLLECCKDIDDLKDMTPSELEEITKQEMIDAIKTNVNTFGLNHTLSLFNVEELREFANQLNLKCDVTSSKDILIDSIIENSNYKKPKQKKRSTKTK